MDYVVRICQKVFEKASSLKGCTITKQPKALRHFTAEFSELDTESLILKKSLVDVQIQGTLEDTDTKAL